MADNNNIFINHKTAGVLMKKNFLIKNNNNNQKRSLHNSNNVVNGNNINGGNKAQYHRLYPSLQPMKKSISIPTTTRASSSSSAASASESSTSSFSGQSPTSSISSTNINTINNNNQTSNYSNINHHNQKFNINNNNNNTKKFHQQHRQKQYRNFDLNDDSAIGLSEKQPLISNDINNDIINDNDGKFKYYPNIHMNYETNSDFGGSNDDDEQSFDDKSGKFPSSDHHNNNNNLDRKRNSKRKYMMDKLKGTTNLQTMMHILKGNIGTGILAMPNAFLNAGLFLGLGMLPILCILCTHCMHILVRANNILSKRLCTGMLEYQEVAEKALSIGPHRLRPYSRWSSKLINTFLLITQFGFCCVYSLFVAENVSKFVSELTPPKFHFEPLAYLAFLLPFFILLSFIKSLRHLSLASSMANLLQTVGLMIVMVNLVQDLPHTSNVAAIGSITKFPLFLGTAIYAFEGIGLVLPLQKEMQNPESLGGYVGVLNTSMTIVACLNIAIGFFGYLKYGENVEGSITLNLPAEPLYQSCKMIFATAIFLSYAIQYYVPFNIIWPWFCKRLELKEGTSKANITEYLFRAFLVVFTVAIAAAVPQLDLFISLVGALSSSGLALIFPPLIDICVLWEIEHGFWNWTWIYTKNFFIFLLGIAGLTTGTYASVVNILIHMANNNNESK